MMQCNVRISDEQWAEVERLAKEMGVTPSAALRALTVAMIESKPSTDQVEKHLGRHIRVSWTRLP